MQLNFTSRRPLAEVFQYLTDMARFATVHPVIYRIDALGADRYRIHERMPIGLPVRFTYPATVVGDVAAGTVQMDATVFGLVQISMRFQLTADGRRTNIREDVAFRSWLPVRAVLERTFRRLHAELFAAIERAV